MADESNTEIIHDNTDGAAASPSSTPLGDGANAPKNSVSNAADALDGLMKQKEAEKVTPAAGSDDVEDVEAKKKADAEAAAKKKADDDAKAKEKSGAVTPPQSDDEKAAAAKKLAEDEAKKRAAAEEPKDKFSEVKLPPYSKPASQSAFDTVKKMAREEIAARDTKIKELEAKIPKNGGLTPDVEKEIKELREFRAAHGFQTTKEFKETYEAPIAANNESILSKLKANGFSDEHLAKIKEIGVDKLDWDPVLEKLPAVAKRAIEAKLLENENLNDKRAKALEEASKSPQQYEEKQKQAAETAKKEEEQVVTGTVEEILNKLEIVKPKAVPPDASESTKAEIEAHNKFVQDQIARKQALLSDRSPQMIGTLVASTIAAYHFKREMESYKAKFEASDSELQKIKKASSTASRRSQAPAAGLPEKKTSILKPGKQALDDLAAEQANKS